MTIEIPVDFGGPVKRRGFTDVFFLVLLLSTWAITSWIGVDSVRNVNFDTVRNPVDYNGRTCGVDKDSEGNTLGGYWYPVDSQNNGVCVDEYPSEDSFSPTSRTDLICKDNQDILNMEGCNSNGILLDTNVNVMVTCGACMFKTKAIKFNRYCNPVSISSLMDTFNEVVIVSANEEIAQWRNFAFASYIDKVIKDLIVAAKVVGGIGFGGSFLLGLLFVFLFMCPCSIGPLLWMSNLLSATLFSGIGALFFFLADEYEKDEGGKYTENEALFVLVLAYASWIVGGLILLSTLCMRREIGNFIGLAKVASVAIKDATFSPFLAIASSISYVIIICAFVLWLVAIAVSKESKEEAGSAFGFEMTYTKEEYPPSAYAKFAALLLGLFWTVEFLVVLQKLAFSHLFGEWYFTPAKEYGTKVSVCRSTLVALFRHTGTAAFGSLVMNIIMAIRLPLMLCCEATSCCCCLFVKSLSNDSYNHSALFGKNLYRSSNESYAIIKNNQDLWNEIGSTSHLSILYPRAFIASTTTLVSYLTLDRYYKEELFSIPTLTILVFIVSWNVAEIFMNLVSDAVSSITYCYFVDGEMMGTEGAQYTPKELDAFLDNLLGETSFGVAQHSHKKTSNKWEE